MTAASVNGVTITAGQITMPVGGAWWATLVLDSPGEFIGAATITMGNMTLVGTFAEGGAYAGASAVRVVGGAGGWNRDIGARAYHSAAGVPLSTVVTDAATAAGETLVPDYAEEVLGVDYVRAAGPARRVLDLLRPGWWTTRDGETKLTARPTGDVEGAHTLADNDRAQSRLMIETEDPDAFDPGLSFGGYVLGTLTWGITGKGWKLCADYGDTADRFGIMFRQAVRRSLPELRYLGVHRYRVAGGSASGLDLVPVSPSRGMPELEGVKVAPGASGASSDPAGGSMALVCFADSDPAQPYVIGFESYGVDGHVPTDTALDGDRVNLGAGLRQVVRVGDVLTTVPIPSGSTSVSIVSIASNAAVGSGVPDPLPTKVYA